MKSLSWMFRIAIAPLAQRPSRFFVYILILWLLGSAIFLFQNFNHALERSQSQSAATLLGGDVDVQIGYRGFEDVELNYLDESSRAQSEIITTRTMLEMDYGSVPQIRLSNLRAVDEAYPLLGEVRFDDNVKEPNLARALAPQQGRYGVLFSRELTDYFGASPGDFVTIMGQEFVFAGTITSTPDAESNFNFLLPSAMISREALEALELDKEQMLLSHRRVLLLKEGESSDNFRTRALTDFHDKGWQIETKAGFSKTQSQNFALAARIGGFVNLAVIIALGVALYSTFRTHLLEERATAQSLAELGASRGKIIWVYGIRLLTLLFFAMLFAYFMVALIYRWQMDNLSAELASMLQLSTWAFNLNALLTTVELSAIALGLGGLCLWFNFQRSNLLLILLSTLSLATVGFWLLSKYQFDRESYAVLASFAMVIFGFWFFVRIFKRIIRNRTYPKTTWRLSLLEYAGKYSAQENFGTLIFANLLVITCFAAIFMSIRNLAEDFAKAPKPTHYVADIQQDQVESFEETMGILGASRVSLSPIVLARITQVNGERPTSDHWMFKGDRYLGADRNDEFDLSITEDGLVEIAMDENLAKEMGLGIGDIFTMSVLDQETELVIRTLRKADLSFERIDFNLILPDKFVESVPHIYVASLKLNDDQRPVIKSIIDRFPNTIVVSSDRVLNRFETWVSQLQSALRLLGIHILSATLIALFSVGWLVMRKERYDQSVFEIMGMSANARRRLQVYKIWLNAGFASLASFLCAWAFVEFGIEPALGVNLELPYLNLVVLALVMGLLGAAMPAILMWFRRSNTHLVEEFSQDFHRTKLDF